MKYTYRAALLIPVFLLVTGVVTFAQDCEHSYARYWQYQGSSGCDKQVTVIQKSKCAEREDACKPAFDCASKGFFGKQQCRAPQKQDCSGQASCGKEMRCTGKNSQDCCPGGNMTDRGDHRAACGIGQCVGRKPAGCSPGKCEERKPGCNCSFCQKHKPVLFGRSECAPQARHSEGKCEAGLRHGECYESNCKMISELNQSRCIPKYYADDLMKRNEKCRRGCEQHSCGGTCASYVQSAGHLETLHGELQEMCRKHSGRSCK